LEPDPRADLWIYLVWRRLEPGGLRDERCLLA